MQYKYDSSSKDILHIYKVLTSEKQFITVFRMGLKEVGKINTLSLAKITTGLFEEIQHCLEQVDMLYDKNIRQIEAAGYNAEELLEDDHETRCAIMDEIFNTDISALTAIKPINIAIQYMQHQDSEGTKDRLFCKLIFGGWKECLNGYEYDPEFGLFIARLSSIDYFRRGE